VNLKPHDDNQKIDIFDIVERSRLLQDGLNFVEFGLMTSNELRSRRNEK